MNWDAFYNDLKRVYWVAINPALRSETRPDPPADEPPVPDELWQAISVIFPDPEAWLHNPIPALSGSTPIAALAAGKLAEVQGCVMSVAGFFLPDPSEIVPWRGDD